MFFRVSYEGGVWGQMNWISSVGELRSFEMAPNTYVYIGLNIVSHQICDQSMFCLSTSYDPMVNHLKIHLWPLISHCMMTTVNCTPRMMINVKGQISGQIIRMFKPMLKPSLTCTSTQASLCSRIPACSGVCQPMLHGRVLVPWYLIHLIRNSQESILIDQWG